MTVGYGFGMLAVGLVVIAIASAIGFIIIKKEIISEKDLNPSFVLFNIS